MRPSHGKEDIAAAGGFYHGRDNSDTLVAVPLCFANEDQHLREERRQDWAQKKSPRHKERARAESHSERLKPSNDTSRLWLPLALPE